MKRWEVTLTSGRVLLLYGATKEFIELLAGNSCYGKNEAVAFITEAGTSQAIPQNEQKAILASLVDNPPQARTHPSKRAKK